MPSRILVGWSIISRTACEGNCSAFPVANPRMPLLFLLSKGGSTAAAVQTEANCNQRRAAGCHCDKQPHLARRLASSRAAAASAWAASASTTSRPASSKAARAFVSSSAGASFTACAQPWCSSAIQRNPAGNYSCTSLMWQLLRHQSHESPADANLVICVNSVEALDQWHLITESGAGCTSESAAALCSSRRAAL